MSNEYETASWPKGLKRTHQREEVLQCLDAADRPLTAAELKEHCEKTNLSTVYRILESFERVNMVEKSFLPDSDTAYYKRTANCHTHYATCLICHRQIPLEGCPVELLRLADQTPGFTITGHKLELYGYCSKCRPQTP